MFKFIHGDDYRSAIEWLKAKGATDEMLGRAYAVWYEYEWNSMLNSYYKHWHLSNAPVGFKLHGNRHPMGE